MSLCSCVRRGVSSRGRVSRRLRRCLAARVYVGRRRGDDVCCVAHMGECSLSMRCGRVASTASRRCHLDAIGALVRRQRRRAATTRCTHAEEAGGRRLLTSVTYALRSFSAESGISAPSSRFLLTSSSSPLARNFKSTVSCGSLYTRVRTGRGRWGGTSALASVARASHRMFAGGHCLLSR